ncbi:hypothetical protein F511_02333 [Dorcoceras hygrometricum]|uniref:Uncharacterized protein n=1 Tax=Dorcoceras hygrometricum TaxID=472368 RepID=A0A2Z7CGA4_9LAMI|nr:hypothetical protein F511_02333 [Dorcoceras hygrometricum]
MDFDRENLVLYSKLFEETDDAVGLFSSSHYCSLQGRNLDPPPSLLHSPIFYDPFEASASGNLLGNIHSSQTVVENKSLQDNNAKRKTKKIKEPVQTRRRRRPIDSKPDIVKGQWTSDEDRLLEKLVEKHGVRKWSSIAQMLPGRIGKQCRERWHNHLKPDIKKDRWSDEEDRILIEAHRQVGNRWAEIARSLPGRSENMIKNHWNATKRRQRKNNSSISPLQDYINNVISSSTSSASMISPSKKSLVSENNIINAGDPHDHQSFIGMQFDFDHKDMDFMEMLSIGYL